MQNTAMASELQSETSRLNGAKSRGPKTPEGKATSARNATTHGMLSKTILIEGESGPRFAALLADITAEIKPRTRIEIGLVEDLATFRWRQRRLLSMESACISLRIVRQDPGAAAEQPSTRAALAVNNIAADSRTLDLIHRQELRFNRQYNRTLNLIFALRSLQNKKNAETNPVSD